MDFKPSFASTALLAQYAALFAACFPGAKHMDAPYLHWLYTENPAGEVIGMDAWHEGRVVAHYACVPARAHVHGAERRVLLSLNTATHPDFQGRGLFTQLAEATYRAAAERGFHAVYGVANAQSTPGFVRKLGFSALVPLDARLGFGAIDPRMPPSLQAESTFHRVWTADALRWRCANPHRPFQLHRPAPGVLAASASTGRWGIRAWAELPDVERPVDAPSVAPTLAVTPAPAWAPRLHLGLRPGGRRRSGGVWMDVPGALRPSPLNFIYRSLVGDAPPDADALFFGLLDFDAY